MTIKPQKHGRDWSESDIARAKAMRLEGATAAAIAEALGRTRATVYAQLAKHKTTIEPHPAGARRTALAWSRRSAPDGAERGRGRLGISVEAARYQMQLAGESIATLRPRAPKPPKAPKAPRVRKPAIVKARSARFWNDDATSASGTRSRRRRMRGSVTWPLSPLSFPERSAEAVRLRTITLKIELPAATKVDDNAIVQNIKDGFTATEIVKDHEVSFRTVARVAKAHDLTVTRASAKPASIKVAVVRTKVAKQRGGEACSSGRSPAARQAGEASSRALPRALICRRLRERAGEGTADHRCGSGVPMPEPAIVRTVVVEKAPPAQKGRYNAFHGRPGKKSAATPTPMRSSPHILRRRASPRSRRRLTRLPSSAEAPRLRRHQRWRRHRHRPPASPGEPAAVVAFAEARGLA